MTLGAVPAKLGDHLERWAAEAPERTFIAERGADGEWARVSYAEALARVRAVATWLLGQKLSWSARWWCSPTTASSTRS